MDGTSKSPPPIKRKGKEMGYINSPPGDTIRDFLEEENMTEVDLAIKLRMVPYNLKMLLSGELYIDEELACQLGDIIGPNAEFWERRESFYRRSFLKKKEDVDLYFGEEPGFVSKRIILGYEAAVMLEEFSKENGISVNLLMRAIFTKSFATRSNIDKMKEWVKRPSKYKTKDKNVTTCFQKR